MTIVAAAVASVLAVIALLHLMWGFGMTWPAHDEGSLARMVVGARGATRMPPRTACVAVFALLASGAILALELRAGFLQVSTLLGFAAGAVFLGRGLAAYIPAWRRVTPEQPFARLDRIAYGPLCLALGAGFLLLSAGRMTSS